MPEENSHTLLTASEKPSAPEAPAPGGMADPGAPTDGRWRQLRAKTYGVGTLRYTLGGLIILFCWLLWGDFCSTVFQGVYPVFLPMFLNNLHVSNTLINFLTVSVGGLTNLLLLPSISMGSDRYRGRRGRRIPILFWSAPVAAAGLITMGFSGRLGVWLHGAPTPLHVLSLAATVLLFVVPSVVTYELFLMITNNVYQYLLRDVVPQDVMPWFLAFFRVVGVVAGALLQYFLLGYVERKPDILCLGLGLLYLVSFAVICLRVREGDYSPPPPRPQGNVLIQTLLAYLGYFRDCLSVGVYRNYIFVYMLLITGGVATGSFGVLFATKTLGIDAHEFGHILSYATLAGGLGYVLMGYLCKHLHAMRVALVSLILLALGPAVAYFFVWDKTSLIAYSIAMVLPGVGWGLGSFAVMMMLFPADKFGKFSSSLMAIGWGSLTFTGPLVGKAMDLLHSHYRMVFLVSLACNALAILPMVRVYLGWKKHGGPHHYVPPLPRAAP